MCVNFQCIEDGTDTFLNGIHPPVFLTGYKAMHEQTITVSRPLQKKAG
jgi:hypothetical protein